MTVCKISSCYSKVSVNTSCVVANTCDGNTCLVRHVLISTVWYSVVSSCHKYIVAVCYLKSGKCYCLSCVGYAVFYTCYICICNISTANSKQLAGSSWIIALSCYHRNCCRCHLDIVLVAYGVIPACHKLSLSVNNRELWCNRITGIILSVDVLYLCKRYVSGCDIEFLNRRSSVVAYTCDGNACLICVCCDIHIVTVWNCKVSVLHKSCSAKWNCNCRCKWISCVSCRCHRNVCICKISGTYLKSCCGASTVVTHTCDGEHCTVCHVHIVAVVCSVVASLNKCPASECNCVIRSYSFTRINSVSNLYWSIVDWSTYYCKCLADTSCEAFTLKCLYSNLTCSNICIWRVADLKVVKISNCHCLSSSLHCKWIDHRFYCCSCIHILGCIKSYLSITYIDRIDVKLSR